VSAIDEHFRREAQSVLEEVTEAAIDAMAARLEELGQEWAETDSPFPGRGLSEAETRELWFEAELSCELELLCMVMDRLELRQARLSRFLDLRSRKHQAVVR